MTIMIVNLYVSLGIIFYNHVLTFVEIIIVYACIPYRFERTSIDAYMMCVKTNFLLKKKKVSSYKKPC